MMRQASLWLALLTGGATFVLPHANDAYAQSAPAISASADVLVIHATEGPTKFIDPLLGNVPQLEKLPLRYNNFKLLDKQPLRLEKGKLAPEIKLINGGSLLLMLTDIDKDKRFHVNLNVTKSGRGMDFVSTNGIPFFVAGQPYKGGVLVIGVVVRP